MNRHLRTALAVTAALGAGLLMTACGGSDKSAASDSASPSASATSSTSATPTPTSPAAPSTAGGSSSGSSTSNSSDDGSAAAAKNKKDSGSKGAGIRNCTSNDISWSVSSESQAGGYFLIKARAESSVTCVLPAALPIVAFGSDGTEAGPAEQALGPAITLRAGVTAYAGVSPKSTNTNGGKELGELIVTASNADPNPVALKVPTFAVDKPIVTNWHTNADDAVPFVN